MLAPPFVAIGMIIWGVPFEFTWLAASVFVARWLIGGLGITVGFHRQQTHGSFKSSKFIEVLLACMGSTAIEGPIIPWVADHRKHHKYTDVQGDPHSPHVDMDGHHLGIVKGLYHAHMGWLPGETQADPEVFAPKLLQNRPIVWVSRLFPVFAVSAYAIPFAIGWFATGELHEAFGVMFWGGFMAMAFTHHVTWSINSICHEFGKRTFKVRRSDRSTNVWWLSLPTFGESWHHNHHAFPTSAFHGLEKGQFDPSAIFIRAMEKLGLVWDVKHPNEEEISQKKVVHQPT
ncbi:MAG TPA: acyl-CoA desaturase [Candidatus Saccharimonadales bacterium]|nr:acyl-CoA desaturase [Candidatus Saccharimonadales bacterium]